MKAENSAKIQFDSLSANEAFARGAAAAFLARYDPTVPQLADIKTAVSEAVTNCIVHAYRDCLGTVTIRCRILPENVLDIVIKDKGHGASLHHRQPGRAFRSGLCGDAELYG